MTGMTSARGESCPICLEAVTGEAFLDQCFHRFCYHCILQWSEMVLTASSAKTGNNAKRPVSPLECPLCKTHYTSIVHDLVSGTKFQRDFLLAPDGRQFRLLEAHRRRLAAYHRPEAPATNPKPTRSAVKANKWLPCWVRRELEALMQDNDVAMVVHHVVGVVDSLQKQSRGFLFRPDASTAQDSTCQNWCTAVAAAVRPFVFEDAETFALELWKFLDAGVDIAFYDQRVLDSGETKLPASDAAAAATPVAETTTPMLLDEDVDYGG